MNCTPEDCLTCDQGRGCTHSLNATRAVFALPPLEPPEPLQPVGGGPRSERFHREFDLTRALDQRRGAAR